jgi:tetratricopeptide (TPR) repeat protein
MTWRYKTVLLLALAPAGFALPARADTIYMVDGLKLECKVHQEEEEQVIVLVYQNCGKVVVPRRRILHIEYDFNSRLLEIEKLRAAAAEAGDEERLKQFKEYYDLGVWAFSKGLFPEAIRAFETARGKPGAGPDLLKLMGQAYDLQRGENLRKAYELYLEYLKTNPEDAEVKKRAEEIKALLGPEPVTPTRPAVVEGMEDPGVYKWGAAPTEWANPCQVRIYSDQGTGNKLLLVQAKAGPRDKFAIIGANAKRLGVGLNLTKAKEFSFRVHHLSEEPLRIAVAFKNQKHDFFESKLYSIKPKEWTEVSVPVTGKVFKSNLSNYTGFTDAISGAENVIEVLVMVYHGGEASLYLDCLGFR